MGRKSKAVDQENLALALSNYHVEKKASQDRLNNYQNLLNDFGVTGNMQNITYHVNQDFRREENEAQYRGDGIARKVIDAPIFDMMRADIDFFEESEGEADEIQKEIKRLNWDHYEDLGHTEAWKQGGAVAFVTFDDPFDNEEEVNPNLVRGIKRIDVLNRWDANPVEWYDDPEEENFGQPRLYLVTLQFTNQARVTKVHKSRIIRFDSPSKSAQRTKAQNMGWNDSRFKSIYDDLVREGVSIQSGSNVIQDFVTKIFKMKSLFDKMLSGNFTFITDRIKASLQKIQSGNWNVIGEGEELEKQGTPIQGLAELMGKYEKRVSASSWVPLSILYSGEGGALNGNVMSGDLENYYRWIVALNKMQRRPPIDRLILFMSYYLNFSPENIDYGFTPLFEITAVEQADIALKISQADGNNIMNQIYASEEARGRYSGVKPNYTSITTDSKYDLELSTEESTEEDQPET